MAELADAMDSKSISLKRSAGSSPVTDIMNTQKDWYYFLQWYDPSQNYWFNHTQRLVNMELTELCDIIYSIQCTNRLFRIVCSNDLKIHSYWYNACKVIPVKTPDVVYTAQGVPFVYSEECH